LPYFEYRIAGGCFQEEKDLNSKTGIVYSTYD